MRKIIAIIFLLVMQTMINAQTINVYIGTYTGPNGSEGIYRAKLELQTGKLSEPELVAPMSQPSFIVISSSGKYLYATAELKKETGQIKSFAIAPATGKLRPLNAVSSEGATPCHLSLRRHVLVAANYTGGSVIAVPVRNDGQLSEEVFVVKHQTQSTNPTGQTIPHPHSANFGPDGGIFVADLGLDLVRVYEWNYTSRQLVPSADIKTRHGAGPRHMSFHPNGHFAYLINEKDETITVYSYDSHTAGYLKELQTVSTLPADFKGKSWCAEVKVHPNGKFLYGSNREHDSIVRFRIDPRTGLLSDPVFQQQGIRWPRHFNLTPDGRYCLVANQKGDNVVVFRVNPENGTLEPTEHHIAISQPTCIQFLP